jgi:hypothetical protein
MFLLYEDGCGVFPRNMYNSSIVRCYNPEDHNLKNHCSEKLQIYLCAFNSRNISRHFVYYISEILKLTILFPFTENHLTYVTGEIKKGSTCILPSCHRTCHWTFTVVYS